MTKKLLLSLGAMVFATVSFAAPKSYEISIPSPVIAGTVQLAAGDYKLRIDGSNATFTDVHTGKSVDVPAKVENMDTKFDATAMQTSRQGEIDHVVAIDLGGSKFKVEFGQ